MTEFSLFAKNIIISFTCPRCQHSVTQRIYPLPSPRWEGDTVEKSQNEDSYDFSCPYCKQNFQADIYVNIYYGELCVHSTNDWNKVENLSIEEDWDEQNNLKSDINMKTPFEDWFEGQVETQYGDMKGIAYLDGHEGPGEVKKMLQDCGVDTKKYAVLGFHCYGFEPVGEHIHATAYIVEKSVISAKGGVENLDYNTDVEEFVLENFDWDVMKRYIKRLSIGFIMPEHLR